MAFSTVLRFIKKLKPYNIVKGLRYLRHYGPKEFFNRLFERLEPDEVPYEPWYESHKASRDELARQGRQTFAYAPLISVAVPAYQRLFYVK